MNFSSEKHFSCDFPRVSPSGTRPKGGSPITSHPNPDPEGKVQSRKEGGAAPYLCLFSSLQRFCCRVCRCLTWLASGCICCIMKLAPGAFGVPDSSLQLPPIGGEHHTFFPKLAPEARSAVLIQPRRFRHLDRYGGCAFRRKIQNLDIPWAF
jgi:hypothetical protein